MRLGEGTGGLLAVPLVQAAARTLGEMATLDGAGIC
jgi:nicotinate-nucleotide--dimethylbenzimidazole phosphoribosyltransferase